MLPRTLFSHLAFALMLVGGLSVYGSGTSPALPSAPESQPQPPLVENVKEILDLLAQERLEPEAGAASQHSILEAILAPLGGKGELLTEAQSVPPKKPAHPIGRHETIAVAVRYLELFHIASDAEEEMRRTLAACLQDHGVILDLRRAHTGNLASAARIADLFTDARLPIVIIIGPDTMGASEGLARELKNRQGAVVIGSPSKGYPYGRKLIALKSGYVLAVPKSSTDEPGRGVYPISPLEPDIQAAFAGDNGAPLAADPLVQKAADLITAVYAFSRQHF